MTEDTQMSDELTPNGDVQPEAGPPTEPPHPLRTGPRPERQALVPLWLYGLVAAVLALAAIGVGATLAVNRSVTRPVPEVVGLDSDVARTRLRTAGFEFELGDRRFSTEPEGRVLEQDPPAGGLARRNSAVRVIVSGGTEEFVLPDIVGSGIVLGRGILEERGLEIKVNAEASDQPRDTVLSTNPSAGSIVHTGDIIIVTVASPETVDRGIVPYRFTRTQFVVDPSKPTTGRDVPLEVSRRLQSLLEASGATVLITRGLSDTDVSAETRAVRAKAASSPAAVVGLDVATSGNGGFTLITPTGFTEPRQSATNSLSGALLEALTLQEGTPATATGAPDAVARATTAPFARVILGTLANREDVASFGDPTWADQVARTIYRALGETYGSQ